jgi:hypothetical protein
LRLVELHIDRAYAIIARMNWNGAGSIGARRLPMLGPLSCLPARPKSCESCRVSFPDTAAVVTSSRIDGARRRRLMTKPSSLAFNEKMLERATGKGEGWLSAQFDATNDAL